jgi:hypothetical protein
VLAMVTAQLTSVYQTRSVQTVKTRTSRYLVFICGGVFSLTLYMKPKSNFIHVSSYKSVLVVREYKSHSALQLFRDSCFDMQSR